MLRLGMQTTYNKSELIFNTFRLHFCAYTIQRQQPS